MTEAELQEFSERNWSLVDAGVRDRCVAHLRARIPTEGRQALARAFEDGEWPLGFHMWMSVRNSLREVVLDDELPEVQYPSGRAYRNWDDFYMAALRQAVAPREGES